MASTYKLYYFDAAGRGAIIRHLFAYGNQSFEDIRIPKDQWPEYKNKTPFGQLPVLEIDGQQVAQSRAIARYLAKKFNLVGKNDLEALKCDELIDTIEDFLQKGLKYFLENDPAQKEIHRKKFFEEDIPYYLEKFEAIVSKNGGYTVGSQVSEQGNNVDSESMLEESEPSENTHRDIQEPFAGPSGTQQQTERSELKPPEGPIKRRKRKHTNISPDITKQRMDDAYKVFKKFSEVDSDSDECALYGELLAKKLRALDEPTRETAMLQIDHLMFSIKHGTNLSHDYPQRNYSFQQRSSANQNLTYFYYQPPSNSHSRTNASFTPSPLTSPSVSPHYQPTFISQPNSSFTPSPLTYQPPSNSHSQQNASFMPSPLTSPSVSPHYQPTFNSQPNSSFTPSPLTYQPPSNSNSQQNASFTPSPLTYQPPSNSHSQPNASFTPSLLTYQPPSNSHSQPNASSLTPSPSTSPVSPHYQPPATSSDTELSHRLTSSEYDENNDNPTFENIVTM